MRDGGQSLTHALLAQQDVANVADGALVIAFVNRRDPLRLLQIAPLCVSDGVPRRSLFVALIVGTVLNLINQGDVFFGDCKLNLAKKS